MGALAVQHLDRATKERLGHSRSCIFFTRGFAGYALVHERQGGQLS